MDQCHSESPNIVSTVLRDQAKGPGMHNPPTLQEENVGGYKYPSKFCAASKSSVVSHWHSAYMRNEDNFTPKRMYGSK